MLERFKRKAKTENKPDTESALSLLRSAIIESMRSLPNNISIDDLTDPFVIKYKRPGDEAPKTLFLGNMLAEYLAGKPLEEIVSNNRVRIKTEKGLEELVKDFSKAKSYIVPLLRSEDYVRKIDVVWDDFYGSLKKVYAINVPGSIVMFGPDRLSEYGISKKQLTKIAQDNLDKIDDKELFGVMPTYALFFGKEHAEMSGYINGDDLLSSSIFAPHRLYDKLRKLKQDRKKFPVAKQHFGNVLESNKFVVVPIRRNCLYFIEVYKGDLEGWVETARTMAIQEAKRNSSYLASATPLLLENGKWVSS
ncbi:MAG: hypothetical protein HY515_04935 [Candidatus Aenigmarchaeota archaeon]|nr:hypothetical protein [Candidatus Aenigmarchaeota archaeon]